MNRERQMARDRENEQLHSAEEYAKNKAMMSKQKVHEKTEGHDHKHSPEHKNEK